jgi:hypothetical protein
MTILWGRKYSMRKPFIDSKYKVKSLVKIINSDEPQYIGLIGRLTYCFPAWYREGYDLAGFREEGNGNNGLIFNITKDDILEILELP